MSIRNGETYMKVKHAEADGNRVRMKLVTTRKEFYPPAVQKAEGNGVKTYIQKADYKKGEQFVYVDSDWGMYNYLVNKSVGQQIVAKGYSSGLTDWGDFKTPVTIKIPAGGFEMTKEWYFKDGVKQYSKNPTITIFECEIVDYNDSTPTPPSSDDSDIPF